jgi:hypothetical protein
MHLILSQIYNLGLSDSVSDLIIHRVLDAHLR